jgi:2-polyprenyl-3-methyl-5-hydroxy-6-metoxy-1,4-benzoquinol methylase
LTSASTDALAERLFGAALGAYELLTVYLGHRLGLYRALGEHASATSAELADVTGTNERYAREWLEQQAVAGILEVEDAEAPAAERRFRLPEGHGDVLVDDSNLSYLVPMSYFTVSLSGVLPALEEAFRTGRGVPWAAYGEAGLEAQAAANKPVFLNLLGNEWLASIEDVHHRLQADPPARVADIACGAGWSSIAIARAYPKAHVDAYDVDDASIAIARANAAEVGLEDRVSFQVRDAGDPALAGRYDLVTVFEAVHDMSRPVEVLGAMRRLASEGGTVLVLDEKVADEFGAPGDKVERLMYTYSVLCCLPVGLSEQPSAATGTVMRTSTLRRYARDAGFADVDVLPLEHDTFRLYRLT